MFALGVFMTQKYKFVAEQEIVIWRSAEDQKRVNIRIGEPIMSKHPNGHNAWACYPKLDGLFPIEKACYGFSSFQAVIVALQACRQLIRDESKGAKIYAVGDLRGSDLSPDRAVSLKELFGME
jgi:hypothetical protein